MLEDGWMKRYVMIPFSEDLRSVNAGVLLHVRLRVWKVDPLSYSGFEVLSEVLRHDQMWGALLYVASDAFARVLEGEFLSLVLWINGTRNNALIRGCISATTLRSSFCGSGSR